MDGQRIRDYWSNEVDALIRIYRQFETLIPASKGDGAAHRGEDGRFIEELLRAFLQRFLPRDLEILNGFILRPAVKTGVRGRERNHDTDRHSSQLDLIVHDSSRYPVFQRFGNTAIVPPEGVIAIISIKKHLRDNDIAHECANLRDAADLCRQGVGHATGDGIRGPFLGLVAARSKIGKTTMDPMDWIFARMRESYEIPPAPTFDHLVGYVGALDAWSIFKTRPTASGKSASYIGLQHGGDESHLGLQFLLTGILSVYYDPTRGTVRRPGYTAFPSHRNSDRRLGKIPCVGLR